MTVSHDKILSIIRWLIFGIVTIYLSLISYFHDPENYYLENTASTPVKLAGLITSVQKNAKKITYNDLRKYKFSRRSRSTVPPKLQALNGKVVNIAGYMIPLNDAKDISEFMLIQYPFFGCCYSIPPEPNETVLVALPKGKSVDYLEKPIRVTGRFMINDTKIDGYTVSLYRIESANIAITSANDKDIKQHLGGNWMPGN